MPHRRKVVVAGYRRTPIVPIGTFFSNQSAAQLGGIPLRELMTATGLTQNDVDKVIVSSVVPIQQGFDRAVLDAAGWDLTGRTESEVINTVCCSGLQACINAQIMIEAGYADCVIVVGTESMTNTLDIVNEKKPERPFKLSDVVGLTSFHNGQLMFMIAEEHRKKHELVRADMDERAMPSFQRAYAAAEVMKSFIVSVEGVDVNGDPFTVDHDYFRTDRKTWEELHIDEETIRAARSYLDRRDKETKEVTAKGEPTLLNVSSKNDGGGAMVICSASFAREHGLTPMARFGHFASGYTNPGDLFEAPVKAAQILMGKGDFDVTDVYQWFLTEAFGNQVAQNLNALSIDDACVNYYGGAIALGHPIGFSGLCREGEAAIYLSRDRAAERAVAGACGGGGRATMHEQLQP